MRSQALKDTYYATVGQLSRVNAFRVRHLTPIKTEGRTVLHLGCGPHYVPGFLNVDGNVFRKSDLWLDVTRGLPFPDDSVAAVFSNHVLEHFTEQQLRVLLPECFRVLKPGGVIRVVTPDLKRSIEAYLANNAAFFSDAPDKRRSMGGRFNNYLLCRDQHRLMFDFGFMEELLTDARFTSCREVSPAVSSFFTESELKSMSDEPASGFASLFVEASKA